MVVPEKLKHGITMWSNNSTSEYIPKRPESRDFFLTDICMPMLRAALFTTDQREKQTKCPSVNKWINKMWYTHTHHGILFRLKKGRNSDRDES